MALVVQRGQAVPEDHPYKDNTGPSAPETVPEPAPEWRFAGGATLRHRFTGIPDPEYPTAPEEPVVEITEYISPSPHFNSYSIDTRRTSTHVGPINDRLHIGQNVEYAEAFFNCMSGDITLCDYAFLGQYVSLLAGTHDYTKRNRERQAAVPGHDCDITIGHGVWVGTRSTIIGPCTIGDHAVIGAGSVVTAGVYEGGCLYAGNPARFIKKIDFTDENPG